MMGKHVQEPARAQEPGRNQRWGIVVAGGSGGYGGFLVLGGVLLATAFTARMALRRRKQPANEGKQDVVGVVGTKDVAASTTACCNKGSSGQTKEETTAADDGERSTFVVEHRTEEPPTLTASAPQSTLPQPPVPPEQHLIVDAAHTDGVHRSDDKESCTPKVPKDSGVVKEEDPPEEEPLPQATEDSSCVNHVGGHKNNWTKTGVNAITEQNGTETDRAEFFKLEDEILQDEHNGTEADRAQYFKLEDETLQEGMPSQASDEQHKNDKVEDDPGHSDGVELDRTSILQLENEILLRDIHSQESDRDDTVSMVDGQDEEGADSELKGAEILQLEDETKVEIVAYQVADMDEEDANLDNNHEERSQEEDINQLSQHSEIPMLMASKEEEEEESIGATNDDGPDFTILLDEALQVNREHVQKDDKHEHCKVSSVVEDEDPDKMEVPSQQPENSGTSMPIIEDQNTMSGDFDNTECLSNTVCLDESDVVVILLQHNVQCEETTQLEPKMAHEADMVWIQHIETALQKKEPLPQEVQDVDHFTSIECQSISSSIAQNNKETCCESPGQDMGHHDLRIQDKALQEERFTEELVATANKGNGQEHEEMRLPLYTSLKGLVAVNCTNQDESDNTSQQTSRNEDELRVPSLEDDPQKDVFKEKPKDYIDDADGNSDGKEQRQVEHEDDLQQGVFRGEAKDNIIGDADGNSDVEEQCQVEHVSDSSDEDSTGSCAETSWTVEETNSSSLYDYEMKSQLDVLKCATDAQNDVPSQQKLFFYSKQHETWFSATKLASKAKDKQGLLPVWHARTSFLQLAYPIVAMMLVLLIICSHKMALLIPIIFSTHFSAVQALRHKLSSLFLLEIVLILIMYVNPGRL